MKKTKADLRKEAIEKVMRLSEVELKNFLKMNCCPHTRTEKCGMDRICKDCGDWA